MNNSILNINKNGFRADISWLPDLEKILKNKFKIKQNISIAFVKPSVIKKLNRVYRDKNKITDVFSFLIESKEILGEVVICLDRAKQQAKDQNKTIKSELQLLVVHGILHLLGYDHEKSLAQAQRQEKMEQDILRLLNTK